MTTNKRQKLELTELESNIQYREKEYEKLKEEITLLKQEKMSLQNDIKSVVKNNEFINAITNYLNSSNISDEFGQPALLLCKDRDYYVSIKYIIKTDDVIINTNNRFDYYNETSFSKKKLNYNKLTPVTKRTHFSLLELHEFISKNNI
jgi:hypothetical protein